MSEKKIAIYHPLIDPDDAGLVKTAALYWDEMQTIVPESIREPYPRDTINSRHVAIRGAMSKDKGESFIGNLKLYRLPCFFRLFSVLGDTGIQFATKTDHMSFLKSSILFQDL